MHPWVRNLYRRAILVGRDYPHPEGMDFVRRTWKKGMHKTLEDEAQLRRCIVRGRHIIREMEGVIQLHKYRSMKKSYGDPTKEFNQLRERLEEKATDGR
eukprot:scaffold49487_cov50-Attheya_sp.AAC.4